MRLLARRVLVEADSRAAAASSIAELEALGLEVTSCIPGGRCPLVAGDPCAAAAQADVVLHALAPGRFSESVLQALAGAGVEVARPGADAIGAVLEARGHLSRRLHRTVRLRDGRRVVLRAIRPADAPALRRFDAGLSEESRRLRYLSYHPPLGDEEACHLADVDFRRRFAFVASAGRDIVGDCRLLVDESGDAELAEVVADDLHGVGLGSGLLDLALEVAEARGVRVVAQVRYDNQGMARLLRRRGFERVAWELGVMTFVRAPGAEIGMVAKYHAG